MRTTENRHLMIQRRRIIDQAERVDRPRIAQQLSPPEASFHADCRHILQLVRGRLPS